ncbi:hypothetical protein AB0J35_57980 [Nonomuraea angiospora]|uniref:hypothetical protein n=1 Tax=Nonomuraea angiospora TaxID=46172 RepID=UPI003421A720
MSDPYTDLYGRRVHAVERTATVGQEPIRLTGVLLPPAEPYGARRLHVDQAAVIEVETVDWILTDERTAAGRKADRRVQECPAGRPVYRYGDLPAHQLATDTMLRRMRRRRRDGQAPIASYMLNKGYAPLYAVADAEELPPLSPVRQEAWDRARTCALCGATRSAGAPYGLGHDQQRYCEPCQEPAAERFFRAQHAERREAAAAWAREVLADPGAPLLVVARPWYPSLHLMYANLAGEVLFDHRLQPSWNDREPDSVQPPAPGTPCYVDAVDVAPQLRDVLTARRLIVWDYELDHLEHFLSDAVAGTVTLPIRDGDRFARHWSGWLGERDLSGPTAYRHNVRFRRPRWPDTPAETIATMCEGLRQMSQSSASGESGEGA